MNVTIPALLFTQSASALRPALLSFAWPIIVLPLLYVCVGLLFGALVVRLAQPRPGLSRVIVAAVAFGNSTGLPLTLLTVIGDLLISKEARDEYGAGVDPVTYLAVYLVLYPVCAWLAQILE